MVHIQSTIYLITELNNFSQLYLVIEYITHGHHKVLCTLYLIFIDENDHVIKILIQACLIKNKYL